MFNSSRGEKCVFLILNFNAFVLFNVRILFQTMGIVQYHQTPLKIVMIYSRKDEMGTS